MSVNHSSLCYITKSYLIHWFHLYQQKIHVLLHGQTLPTLSSIFFLIICHHLRFLTLFCLVWDSSLFYLGLPALPTFFSFKQILLWKTLHINWCCGGHWYVLPDPFQEWRTWSQLPGALPAKSPQSWASSCVDGLSWRGLVKVKIFSQGGLHPVTDQHGEIIYIFTKYI